MLGANEAVQDFLNAVEVALLHIATGLEPIPEHRCTNTAHQGLPRQLHLAARPAEYVAQNLAENVSSRGLLRLA